MTGSYRQRVCEGEMEQQSASTSRGRRRLRREARASVPPLPPPQDCCSVLPMPPNCLLPDTGQALLPHLQPGPFSCISCQQFLQDLPTFSVTDCRGFVRFTYSDLIYVCRNALNVYPLFATLCRFDITPRTKPDIPSKLHVCHIIIYSAVKLDWFSSVDNREADSPQMNSTTRHNLKIQKNCRNFLADHKIGLDL